MKQDESSSYNVLKFLWRHAQGQKRWYLLAAAASLVSVAAGFLVPQIIRFAVDSVLGADPPPALLKGFSALLSGGDTGNALLACAAVVLVLAAMGGLFNFFSRMGIAEGTEQFCRNLRGNLFRHIQYLPFGWHVEHATGDIVQRCTSDLEVVRGFLSGQLLEVVRTLLLIAVALGLMFTMNLSLSLVAVVYVPLILTYSGIFYRLVGNRFLQADEAEGELTTMVQENLTGVRVVRAFGRERFELDRFDKYNGRFAGLWMRLGHILSIYWGVGDLVTGLQILSVVVAGALLCVNGTLTLGEYLVFVSYNQMLAWPVRALGRTLSMMSETGVSAGRLQEILDAREEAAEPAAQKPDLHADIRFENVTFGYGGQPVLQDLTFTIPKGTTFGILGATGSGKSTITYLLNRLYDLPEGMGRIWFGDTEVHTIDRYYLRRRVGLVLQEPYLFSKTIQQNIAIATASPGLESVRAAARVADLDEAVQGFSRGYDTLVGERGVTLSGGQKQRVAIARTLMLDAPVMVFDDSMSAVDLETDAHIRDALRTSTGDSTVILISHRINTLMRADNILVLTEDGRMEAMGTHAQLIRRPGLYQRIYEMQSRAAEEAGETLDELGAAPALEGGV